MTFLDYVNILAIVALFLWVVPTLLSSGSATMCVLGAFLAISAIVYFFKKVLQ